MSIIIRVLITFIVFGILYLIPASCYISLMQDSKHYETMKKGMDIILFVWLTAIFVILVYL